MNDETGPSHDTLRKLREMLPSAAKALVEKKALGKGVKVDSKKPTKVCGVCGKLHDYIVCKEPKFPEPGNCLVCDALLKEHNIAFVSGTRYIFAKSEKLKDMAGTIVHISEPVFESMAKQFAAKVKEKEAGETPEPTPEN